LQQDINHEKAVTLIRSAAQQGCHLAVLPEYHLNSYVAHDQRFTELCTHWKKYLEAYKALAKELNICIVPGTILQTEPAEGEHRDSHTTLPHSIEPGTPRKLASQDVPLYNVAYFISSDGSISGSYTKKNLWGLERIHQASSGRTPHSVLDTPLGKVGLLICWDLAFPEAFRELIAAGAKIIIIPTFWKLDDCSPAGLKHNPTAEALFLDSTVTSRTFENTCAVVFCNAGGPPGESYAGLSQVAAPFVGPLVRLGSSAEGMAVADLDMDLLEEAERNYQVRADLALEDWHYDYRHDQKREQGSC
jgi:predicted amidohydrolase